MPTAQQIINQLSSQVVYNKPKTKKNYDKEIINLYENIILSFMKKNKITYFQIAPIHSEDENPRFLPILQESNLNYKELDCLLDQPITLTIQEKLINYIIAESLFSTKLEFLINGKYWSEYYKKQHKVISLREMIEEIINQRKEFCCDCNVVFINKNKFFKITQQKNIGKRIKREQRTRQAIEWQERYKEDLKRQEERERLSKLFYERGRKYREKNTGQDDYEFSFKTTKCVY